MGKRRHKNKEVKNNEDVSNKNYADFTNNNENLNPLDFINYLGLNKNLNSNSLLKMIINSKFKKNTNGNKEENLLMDLLSNINTDGVNMNDINKLSESLKNISNPQDVLRKIVNNKLNLDNNINANDNLRKRRKSKDVENLEFLKSLRNIVDASKAELLDKIIIMYENGEI